MPLDSVMDQAAGLRRMLLRASARVVTVASARNGAGTTSVVVNLATVLAKAGKEVLVLDENLSHANVGNMLGLRPRYDLLHAVRRDKTWREVTLRSRQGVRVLPVARAIQALPQLAVPERENLLECLVAASHGMDVVLVDTALRAAPARNVGMQLQTKVDASSRSISASLAPDQSLLLVLNGTAASITESYALIKHMAVQDGRQSFGIVVNKVRDGQEAQVVFSNVAQVARRHLHVRMEYLGYIPIDEKLRYATQLCKPVVEAYPDAQAACAFGNLGHGLMLLPAASDEEAASLVGVVQRLMRQARPQNRVHAA